MGLVAYGVHQARGEEKVSGRPVRLAGGPPPAAGHGKPRNIILTPLFVLIGSR